MKKLKGHTDIVNSVHSARRGPQLVCSGSDDCTVKIWDPRRRADTINLDNLYQVLAVTFNDMADQVITAGIDNDVKVIHISFFFDSINVLFNFPRSGT